MLQIGDTIEETTGKAAEDISPLVSWEQENAVHFDHEKTEVMHFSRQRARNFTPLPIQHEGVAKRPGEALRWLEIWFDQKLSFTTHVDKWAIKANSLAFHLRSLANTKRAAPISYAKGCYKLCYPHTPIRGRSLVPWSCPPFCYNWNDSADWS